MSVREEFVERSQYVDWWHADLGIRDFRETLPMTDHVRGFFEQFSPSALPYYSPLNSVFSVQFRSSIERINSRPTWILRDGRVPLTLFFKGFPSPKSIKSRLYVEASLAPYVPETWRAKVGTYRVLSKDAPAQPSENILLCGSYVPHGHGQSVQDLQSQLQSLGKMCAPGRQVFAYLPKRSPSLEDDESSQMRYFTMLHAFFGTNITPWDWAQIQYKADFIGYELIEIVGRQFIADSYTSHLVLARGGHLSCTPLHLQESYFELSPYHGFALREFLPDGRHAISDREVESMVAQFQQLHWLING